VPEDGFVVSPFGDAELLVVRTLYTGDEGFDLIGPSAALAALREQLLAEGAAALSPETLEVLRIEAGRPRWGAELDENVIPLEAGIEERAISRSKGCYTGQEVIVRILHRGHVNWLLRGVLLEDSPLPTRDAALVQPADGRRIGRITSACASPRQAQGIALAYVRRELEPPVEVRLERPDGATVTVVELPFPSTGLGQAASNELGA
jgi:folate-binding protein YgfZ